MSEQARTPHPRGTADARKPLPPDVATHYVSIPVYEGVAGYEDAIYAPPGQVLQVCVVGDHVFLDLADYDESYDHTETSSVAKIHVDANALLNALLSQMTITWPQP